MTHSFPTRRSSDHPVFRRLGLSHKQTKTTGTLFLSYLRLFLASSRETTSEGSSAYPTHAEFPLFVLYVVCHVVSLDRKSVEQGKRVSVRGALGGRLTLQSKTYIYIKPRML